MLSMMTSMRVAMGSAVVACGALMATFGAGAAYAAGVATTNGATAITSTSAVLNGTAHTTNADSSWLFQYGTTTAYGHNTPVTKIGSGVFSLEATVKDLLPGATYHFRLAVIQGSYPATISYGADGSFVTLKVPSGIKYGRASLRSHVLVVHKNVVSIPISCTGAKGARCQGRISLTARVKHGKRFSTVGCGSATLNTLAGRHPVLKARLGVGCRVPLARARRHRLSAKLKGAFTTHQKTLKTGVTLVRR
jgi:hypothetical protein